MAQRYTVERKRAREKEQRRRRILIIGGTIAAIVVLLVVLLIAANQPADAPVPETALTRYADLDQGQTADGYPILGDDDAPVQVSLYCNFDSDGCAAFNQQAIDPLIPLIRDDRMALTFVPVYSNQGNSQGAVRAAVCAAEQNRFWPMQDALFVWYQQFGAVQAFTNSRLVTGLDRLGLDRGQYNGCIGSGRPDEVLNAASADTTGLTSFTNTPGVAVNNVLLTDDTGAQITDPAALLAEIQARVEDRAPLNESGIESTVESTSQPTPAPSEQPEATVEPAVTGGATEGTTEGTVEPAADATPEATEA